MIPKCPKCPHPFHALASCVYYDSVAMKPCPCQGHWHEEDRAISGFCYIIGIVLPEVERKAHEACPGQDYVYPCECDCHSLLDDAGPVT